jgi:glucose/galactose transporter
MKVNNKYMLAIVLVTSLFFLWGVSYGLLDVLNKHFQETLHINKSRSTYIQLVYFGAYFTVAFPAGLFMNRFGYRKGIIAGLILYAIGAFLFYPSAQIASFQFFLFSLFILASGLTFLETAANPYMTILGDAETSAFRLNLAQSFNGVGSFIGPIIGGLLFFTNNANESKLNSVSSVYLIIATVVFIIACCFFFTPMPEGNLKENSIATNTETKKLFKQKHFIWAVIAQFFYVAAQVGIAALFINYCTEHHVGMDNKKASFLLSAGLVLFTIGRFTGTALMKIIPPNKLLAIYSLINILLSAIVVTLNGYISIYCLVVIFFFESIMFPTIFALGVRNLGSLTKKGASFIIMAIVGGAIMPVIMGAIAQSYSTQTSYIIPLICFLVVFLFGVRGYKIKGE